MAGLRHLINGFLAGEISPWLYGRTDTEHYALGVETCENFVPRIEGPLVKRPGFEMIRPAASTAAWLSAFRFSVTQEYALEWSDAALRFYTNDGRIETDATHPYEVTTPYTAAQAPYLSMQQSFDRLYIDHASHAPAALSRTAATTFSLANLAFTHGPFKDVNTDETIKVTASGVSGSVTLTATGGSIFDAGHVGSPFYLEALDFSDVKAWEPGMDSIAIGDKVRSDNKLYEAATAGKTGSVQPIHDRGSEWDGMNRQDVLNAKGPYGVKWTFLAKSWGTLTITAVTSGTTATAMVVDQLPDSLTSVASYRWALGAFSTKEGWPSLVFSWAGRLCHIKDFEIEASVVGDYLNHESKTSSGTLAADLAFRRTIATENPPVWAVADRQLIVGTPDKEIAVGPTNTAAAVSGDNIEARPQSFYGSDLVWPVQVGTETVYIERGGRRVRSASYEFAQDRYAAIDLTAAAGHILKGGAVQLAFQRQPFAMIHVVRADGQLITHPVTRDQVKGFGRTVLGGGAKVLSAVSVMGTDGRTDDLWVLVERVDGSGTTVREVWKQHAWRELGEDQRLAFYVDGGVQVSMTGGVATVTGLDHLADQDVAVLCNGGVVPGLTVANDGSLTLPTDVVPASNYTLTVGLAYTATAVLLRPAANGPNGPVQGVRQQVKKLVLRVLESVGFQVGAKDGTLFDVIDRPGSAPMDAPIPLYTGDTPGGVDMDYDRAGQVQIVSSVPLPATINAAIIKLNYDVNDD